MSAATAAIPSCNRGGGAGVDGEQGGFPKRNLAIGVWDRLPKDFADEWSASAFVVQGASRSRFY